MTDPALGARLAPMLRARRFDELLLEHREHVLGAKPVGIGQEGTAAAVAAARHPGDTLTLNHRNHHHLLAGGADAETVYREVFGRDGGPQRGRSGTLHLVDPANGVQHTSAMVGSSVPLAVGMALAHQRRGTGAVAFATLGDGAMSEGVVSESFNLATLWTLPVVFVCESNARPVGEQATPIIAASRLTDLPAAHRVPAVEADATRPAEIGRAIADAAARARDGGGPRFVLAQTVPWPGNAGFMPTTLPPVDLRAAAAQPTGWEADDPVLHEVRDLLAQGVALDAVLALDVEIKDGMQQAVTAALAAPEPPPAAALEHVLGVR